jgi:hypothetical protein
VIWLGEKHGNLSDWVTQRWVQVTGRRLALSEYPWLDGPIGNTLEIGRDYFENYFAEHTKLAASSTLPLPLYFATRG